jgi:hypothetical protein
VAKSIFLDKINTRLLPWKYVAQNGGLRLYFSKKLTKENNRPFGENSLNLGPMAKYFCR